MKYIKNIKLLILVGLISQAGISFAKSSDSQEQGQRILNFLERFEKIPVPKLIEAVERGNLEDVKNALNNLKTNINEEDKHNKTALMYAAISGRKDIVKLLLDKGADPHVIGWNDETALRDAVKKGHKEIIKLLVDADSKFKKHSMGSALVEAAQKGDKDSVILLLDKGADPNSKACSHDPSSPPLPTMALIEATLKGYKDIVRLLLDKGANPNIQAEVGYGLTALEIAERNGDKEIVQLIKSKSLSKK